MTGSPPKYSSLLPTELADHSQPDLEEPPTSSGASLYTLRTIPIEQESRPGTPESMHSSASDRTPLITTSPASYGVAEVPHTPGAHTSTRRLLFNAALKMAVLFVVSTVVLGGTLWLALPTLEEADRPMLRIPKSFAQLKALNYLLHKYRDIYPVRVLVCYVITYFFLQAFSLPGSMYLSILGGAVWGIPIALPLACSCVATGATLCYLISAAFGPALLALPKWKARLDNWTDRLAAQRENLLSYLIVIRIAPFPPHWVVNVLAPHLGVGIPMFWISTFLGIFGVTVIHTTIGRGLEQMTGPEDFHLISWRNFLGLSAVVLGAMIPVGLRWLLKKRTGIVLEGEDELRVEEARAYTDEDTILAQGPIAIDVNGKGKSTLPATAQLILLSDSEDESQGDDLEEDEILEAGPTIDLTAKGKAPATLVLVPQPLQPTPPVSVPVNPLDGSKVLEDSSITESPEPPRRGFNIRSIFTSVR